MQNMHSLKLKLEATCGAGSGEILQNFTVYLGNFINVIQFHLISVLFLKSVVFDQRLRMYDADKLETNDEANTLLKVVHFSEKF